MERQYTLHAQQAIGLVDLIRVVFAEPLEGPVRYRLTIAAPDGPSTAGGKLALQHLALVPEGPGPTIVIGAAHSVERTAELRSFAYLQSIHAARFGGASVPLDPARFAVFQRRLQAFFQDQGIRVSVVEAPLVAALPLTRESSGGSVLAWIAIACAFVVILAGVAYLYVHR